MDHAKGEPTFWRIPPSPDLGRAKLGYLAGPYGRPLVRYEREPGLDWPTAGTRLPVPLHAGSDFECGTSTFEPLLLYTWCSPLAKSLPEWF